MEKMKELYEKVAGDSDLREKFEKIMKDSEKAGTKETEEKLTAFAKEAGYGVTVEEMQAFFKDLAEKAEGEISEAELDMVAGGKSTGQILYSVGTVAYGCGLSSVVKRGDEIICRDPGRELGL